MKTNVFVVIPNLNGQADLPVSVDAVLKQSYKNLTLVIVDNGSTDGSRELIKNYQKKDPRVKAILLDKNYGYTGGMNPGLQMAINQDAKYVAGCNNDAKPDKDWLKYLVDCLETKPEYGTAACKLLHFDGKTYDSTADQYTSWGLAFPRGRDEPVKDQYDDQLDIFGASGGASLYRVSMLKQIGLFDQDFFAYYEDIDLSFRAHLAGWKICFAPKAVVYHHQGNTTARLGNGFATYQYMKNLPMVIVKNLPLGLIIKVLPRFALAYTVFFVNAWVTHKKGWQALKGLLRWMVLLPKKLLQRRQIQASRKVSSAYIWSIMVHDLPPNAQKLRSLRDALIRPGRRQTAKH